MNPFYLAFDTATEACSVALGDNAVTCFVRQSNDLQQTHTQHLLAWFQEGLDTTQRSVSDLSGIVCTVGPGSFTGVRLGISVAQALAVSQNIPVVGVSTLHLLAQQAPPNATRIMTVLDARMKQVYWGCFHRSAGELPVLQGTLQVSAPEEAVSHSQQWGSELCVLGSGLDAYLPLWRKSSSATLIPGIKPEAPHLLPFLRNALTQASSWPAQELTPLYVRNQVV